jgi:hypothetical protein
MGTNNLHITFSKTTLPPWTQDRRSDGWGDKKYVEDADFASVTVFRHKDAPFSGYVVLGE